MDSTPIRRPAFYSIYQQYTEILKDQITNFECAKAEMKSTDRVSRMWSY